jgi:methionyl-tRNA formyltransferase
MTTAVVFAYHDVGVRCLSVLLAHGVDVRLVVTLDDDPVENIWFASVAELAERHDLPMMKLADPNTHEFAARVRAVAPDFIFSFYYRSMLGQALLGLARVAALNMHGSLLPKYRGRAPVNWAIIHGERETGATLHHMEVKPDAGAIVDQLRVPILPDDTGLDVFRKVTFAAEICLDRSLPGLIDGTSHAEAQDLSQGSYFGGRKPEDGVIDWSQPARRIHDLVRAVAPPYPGATTIAGARRLRILRTVPAPRLAHPFEAATLFGRAGRCYACTRDGSTLRLVELEVDGVRADLRVLAQELEAQPVELPPGVGGRTAS